MRTTRKLLVEQLDRKLQQFSGTEKIIVPEQGWINNIRLALNMTLAQLGNKLNMTRQGAKRIEESESSGSISIKSMKEIGAVLNMKFVYAFVPNDGSIEQLIQRKAEELAKKIVLRTSHNMKLENQGNSEDRIAHAVNELADEYKREVHKSLWD